MSDMIYTYSQFMNINDPTKTNIFTYIYVLLQNDNIDEISFNLSYANFFNPIIEETKSGRIIYHNKFMPKGILVVDEILPEEINQKEKEAFANEVLRCWKLKIEDINFYVQHILEDAKIVLAPQFMDKQDIMNAIQDYTIQDQEACKVLTLAYKELFYPEFLVMDKCVYIKEQYKIGHPANKDKMFWVNLIYVENFFYDDEYYSEDHTIEFANKIVECWNKKLNNEGLNKLAKAIMIDDDEDGVFVSIVSNDG